MKHLFYAVTLIILSACSYNARPSYALDEAQALMDDNPEEAYNKLNALDISTLGDSAEIARWALLYSEALAANHLYTPSDSILKIAINYYSANDCPLELKRAVALGDSIRRLSASSPDPLLEARYIQKEKEYTVYVERLKREQAILIALVLITLTLAVILWQRQRLKLKESQNSLLMAEAAGLKEQIRRRNDDASELQCRLHELLDTRFTLIDSLCGTYYESQGTKNERKAITDKVKAEIEAVKNDPQIFADMQKAVNSCRDNILSKIKTRYSAIKPEEYRLAVYLACGLSSRAISLLLGETVDNVYKRKSRLKLRLKALQSPDSPDFMTIF